MNMSTNASSDPDVSRPVDSDEDLRTDDDDDDDNNGDRDGDDNLMESELGTTANANGKCFKSAIRNTPFYKM